MMIIDGCGNGFSAVYHIPANGGAGIATPRIYRYLNHTPFIA